jgi:hypothetical protein
MPEDTQGSALEHLHAALGRLREQRPVFYSEADFQHALAWELHLAEPDARLHLEAPLLAGGRERLDLFAWTARGRLAIELKYPRAGFRAEMRGARAGGPTPASAPLSRDPTAARSLAVESSALLLGSTGSAIPGFRRRLVSHVAPHELVEARDAEVEVAEVLRRVDEPLADEPIAELG